MDALTEILGTMRLSSAVFLDAEFTEPWCIAAKIGPEDCRPYMAPPAKLIAYHYVLEGALFVSMEGVEPLACGAGQLLLMPRNDGHLLGSEIGLTPVNADDLIEPAGEDGLARIRYGGGGRCTRILCGFLGSNSRDEPLLSALPSLVVLDLGRLTGDWIVGSMRYAARELASGGPAAASSLARMAELLFAEAVREYVKGLPPGEGGPLGAIRDPQIGRALALIHARLAHDWTLAELSHEVGMSRSALVERFTRRLGMSPIRYLHRRRLERAAAQLRESRQPVAQIAYDSGYESEAAFSRAFKRALGASPAAFRRAADQDAAAT